MRRPARHGAPTRCGRGFPAPKGRSGRARKEREVRRGRTGARGSGWCSLRKECFGDSRGGSPVDFDGEKILGLVFADDTELLEQGKPLVEPVEIGLHDVEVSAERAEHGGEADA